MFKKTIIATAVGASAVLAAAAPASAWDTEPPETGQIGLININDTLNNICLLPWNDGNVLAVEVPILSPNAYAACNGNVVD